MYLKSSVSVKVRVKECVVVKTTNVFGRAVWEYEKA